MLYNLTNQFKNKLCHQYMDSLDRKKVAVTGCAGFIGSHICKQLLDAGAIVTGLDNLARDNANNLAGLRTHPNFTFRLGDIRDAQLLDELCHGMDFVDHQAAVCIRYCQGHQQDAIDVNVKGTINVLEACVNNKVKKIVAASSASVYGDPLELPIREEDPLLAKNLYGLTKIMNEEAYEYYWREHGLPFVAFRYMNVYGPRQNTDAFYTSVIPLFIKSIMNNQPPTITGDGSQTMDFVHVNDVARANVMALANDCCPDFYNVGTGTETNIKQVCDMLLSLMKSKLKPIYKQANSIDVNHRRSDITRIMSELKWKPEINLSDGLQTVINDIQVRSRDS